MIEKIERLSRHGGFTVLESVVAISISLILAALVQQTISAYQGAYHRHRARLAMDQEAAIGLQFMAAELATAEARRSGHGCPPAGIRVGERELAFAANVYDRSTALRENAPAGRTTVVVAEGGLFDVGDWVMLENAGDVSDPSDDTVECALIEEIDGPDLRFDQALHGTFPATSVVSAVHRIRYQLDEDGRLMRSQDGVRQRLALHVSGLTAVTAPDAIWIQLAWRRNGVVVSAQRRIPFADSLR